MDVRHAAMAACCSSTTRSSAAGISGRCRSTAARATPDYRGPRRCRDAFVRCPPTARTSHSCRIQPVNSDVWVQNVDGSDLRQLTDRLRGGSLARLVSRRAVDSCTGRFAMASGRPDVFQRAAAPAEAVVEGFFRGDWIRSPMARHAGGDLIGRCRRSPPAGCRATERRVGGSRRNEPLDADVQQDGRLISIPYPDGYRSRRHRVADVDTGEGRLAMLFDQPFQITSAQTSWTRPYAFIVNRGQPIFPRRDLQQVLDAGRTSTRRLRLQSSDYRLTARRPPDYSPNSRAAFSFTISGRTSSRIAIFSKSASHRSGVISG